MPTSPAPQQVTVATAKAGEVYTQYGSQYISDGRGGGTKVESSYNPSERAYYASLQPRQISPQEDARLEQIKHDQAFSQPRNDNNVPRSAAFNAINAQYAASRNQVITSGGSVYQGEITQPNPYAEDTAAGIAWDVARTGGATDTRLNAIAETQIASVGGDASFIRYATDIYVERPSYAQETLTTRDGQTFVNPAWVGVPIRLNLTKEEMRQGLNPDTSNKYYQYNQDTFMLDSYQGGAIPVDPGVHTRFGDFGGPILQSDGSYGGWRPQSRMGGNNNPFGIQSTDLTVPPDYKPFVATGRIKGSNIVADAGTRIDATSPQNVEVLIAGGALPKPFRGGGVVSTKAPKEFDSSRGLLAGFLPTVSEAQYQAYATANKARPLEASLETFGAGIEYSKSALAGATSQYSFGLSEMVFPAQKYEMGALSSGEQPVMKNQWEQFTEGSGRVARTSVGVDMGYLTAREQIVQTETGATGVYNRLQFGAEKFMLTEPANLAPAALQAATFVYGGAAIGAGVGYIATGTSRAAPIAAAMVSPTGQLVTKFGVGTFFASGYAIGVTESKWTPEEGFSMATPEKTQINIGSTLPTLATMWGAGGGLDWTTQTRVVNTNLPSGATARGISIYDQFFGGGRTPTGERYVGVGNADTGFSRFTFGTPQPRTSPPRAPTSAKLLGTGSVAPGRGTPMYDDFVYRSPESDIGFGETIRMENFGKRILDLGASDRPLKGTTDAVDIASKNDLNYNRVPSGINYKFGVDYNKGLPYEPATFDKITSRNALGSAGGYTRPGAFKPIYDVTKPGGTVEIIEPRLPTMVIANLKKVGFVDVTMSVGKPILTKVPSDIASFPGERIELPGEVIITAKKPSIPLAFAPQAQEYTEPRATRTLPYMPADYLKKNINVPSETEQSMKLAMRSPAMSLEAERMQQNYPDVYSKVKTEMGIQTSRRVGGLQEPKSFPEKRERRVAIGLILPSFALQSTERESPQSKPRPYPGSKTNLMVEPISRTRTKTSLESYKKPRDKYMVPSIRGVTTPTTIGVTPTGRLVPKQTRVPEPTTQTEPDVFKQPPNKPPVTDVPYKPPYTPPPVIQGGGWAPPFGGGRGSPQRGYGIRSAVATHSVGADLLGASRGSFVPMAMPRTRKSKKMGMPSFRMPRF